MAPKLWNKIVVPEGNETHLWELFHEACKLSPFDQRPSAMEIEEHAAQTMPTLPFEAYPVTSLDGELAELKLSVEQAIGARVSDRELESASITLRELATILRLAYGTIGYARAGESRAVASEGGLYPLEVYFHGAAIEGLGPGIYHFNPLANNVCCLRAGDQTQAIAPFVLQQEIALTSTVQFFITAAFDRSTFEYGERGYRYILFEAGRVAQNINLIANALGFGALNLGGFMDRDIDELLGIDGVNQASVYMVAIGRRRPRQPLTGPVRLF